MLAGLTLTFEYSKRSGWGAGGETKETKTFYVNDLYLLTLLDAWAKYQVRQVKAPARRLDEETFDAPYEVQIKGDDATGYWIAVWPFFKVAHKAAIPKSYLKIGPTKIRKILGLYMSSTGDKVRATDQDEGALGPDEGGGFSYPQFKRELSELMRRLELTDAELVTRLRLIIRDEESLAAGRDQALMTTLAATLVIAEPARNPRAFLTSLMVLDLMELPVMYGANKPYTWSNVLDHPESDGTGKRLKKPQKGGTLTRVGNKVVGSTVTDVTVRSNLTAMVGGKLPFAKGGSGQSVFADTIRPDRYYIQQKEVTIMVRWLAHLLKVPGLNWKKLLGATSAVTWGTYDRADGIRADWIDISKHKPVHDVVRPHLMSLVGRRAATLSQMLAEK